MNSVKKTMKKGFTLVELIVVMAIMSILLVAVMSMTTPVSRMFRRTTVSENSYAFSNNVQSYLQRSLQYADNVRIFDAAPGTPFDIEGACKDYKKDYYDHIVTATSEGASGNCHWTEGTIRVLHLVNSGDEKGQIKLSTYNFSSERDAVTPIITEENQINAAFFTGDNAQYNITYAIGPGSNGASGVNSKLDTVVEGGQVSRNSDTDPYYHLNTEGMVPVKDFRDTHVAVIVNRGEITTKNGATAFEGPAVLSVANLPFTNISERKNPGQPLSRPTKNSLADNDVAFQRSLEATYAQDASSFHNNISAISTQNDIYFVYSYADELK